jgi:glycosyltransferase involved in cell wall biosynthesis
MYKLAIIFANYGPYHVARVAAATKFAEHRSWEIIGIELAREEKEYPWQVESNKLSFNLYSVINNRELEKVPFVKLLGKLYFLLNSLQPNVVAISGYSRPTMLATLLWCFLYRRHIILFSDSKEDDAPRNWLTEFFKSLIVKRYQAALIAGKPHGRYLVKLGMPSEAIFYGYDVVGNEDYHPDKIRHLPKPIAKSYFLAINRFVAKKNLPFLLNAYASYRQATNQEAWDLVLCGDGELRPQLEQQIARLGIQEYVHLPGFLQQEQLLPYFAHAECFIHASVQEQWGLVVNEAMAAGLPVLVSNCCGCFEDLIIEGVNGFGFDPTNQKQLTDIMLKVSSGEVNLEKMGQAALEHIQKFSPDYFAQGLMQAVGYALAHR